MAATPMKDRQIVAVAEESMLLCSTMVGFADMIDSAETDLCSKHRFDRDWACARATELAAKFQTGFRFYEYSVSNLLHSDTLSPREKQLVASAIDHQLSMEFYDQELISRLTAVRELLDDPGLILRIGC